MNNERNNRKNLSIDDIIFKDNHRQVSTQLTNETFDYKNEN